jgi:RNA polymerase sigma-70 factor (ECF subfamily)
MDDTTEQLARAADGDTAAFARFYDATVHRAWVLARALTGDPRAAEAVLREAYDVAWRSAHEQPGTGLSPQAWVCALVRESTRMRDGAGPVAVPA